jgi:cation transporter-like permease
MIGMRILAFILGLLMVLPGLCTLAFGGIFALNALGARGNDYGMGQASLIWLLVGGVVTWVGVLVLIWAFRRRDPNQDR